MERQETMSKRTKKAVNNYRTNICQRRKPSDVSLAFGGAFPQREVPVDPSIGNCVSVLLSAPEPSFGQAQTAKDQRPQLGPIPRRAVFSASTYNVTRVPTQSLRHLILTSPVCPYRWFSYFICLFCLFLVVSKWECSRFLVHHQLK